MSGFYFTSLNLTPTIRSRQPLIGYIRMIWVFHGYQVPGLILYAHPTCKFSQRLPSQNQLHISNISISSHWLYGSVRCSKEVLGFFLFLAPILIPVYYSINCQCIANIPVSIWGYPGGSLLFRVFVCSGRSQRARFQG